MIQRMASQQSLGAATRHGISDNIRDKPILLKEGKMSAKKIRTGSRHFLCGSRRIRQGRPMRTSLIPESFSSRDGAFLIQEYLGGARVGVPFKGAEVGKEKRDIGGSEGRSPGCH